MHAKADEPVNMMQCIFPLKSIEGLRRFAAHCLGFDFLSEFSAFLSTSIHFFASARHNTAITTSSIGALNGFGKN